MSTATDRLPEETEPDKPEDNFKVSEVVLEMAAAVADATGFCYAMDRAERTRLCWWYGKDGTGRKNGGTFYDTNNTPRSFEAKPWRGAADHEVHLAQELLNERNAMRVAAIMRGNLCVDAINGTDAQKAGMMKTVMRYYLTTAMKSIVPVQGLRAGSVADRFGHSVLYIGWKEERGVERKTTSIDALAKLLAAQSEPAQQPGATPGDMQMIQLQAEDELISAVLDKNRAEQIAALLLSSDPGLKARGSAGMKEALRAVGQLRKAVRKPGQNIEVEYFSSFVKYAAPIWETLTPFVDIFYPAETVFEDNLETARWIGRPKWVSAQQLREQAMIHGWDKKWVEEVIKNQRGKAHAFTPNVRVPWVLSGVGVRWVANGSLPGSSVQNSESQRNLFQIIELWDRSTTSDGLTGVYHTVLHPGIPDMVGKRELLEYWSGSYPFVPLMMEKDEKMLLGGRGLPEIVRSAQDEVKAQLDSRTDAASLTTVPPWTGPPELKGTKISPGCFIEDWRSGSVKPFVLPPPDGRSIEIENNAYLRIARFFGRINKDVPQSLSMLMGQSDMDWFLMSFSQAVALTAKLVQQFMTPLKAARITGTDIEFDATPEDVRGSFDFNVRFDVRALDIEWATQILKFITDVLMPLDNKGIINRGPLIEYGFNTMADPSLAQRCIKPEEDAQQDAVNGAKKDLTEIFSGGGPEVTEGSDYETYAQTTVNEFNRSPLRQEMVAANPQVHAVFTQYLKQLVDNITQHEVNPQVGRNLGRSPLQEQSPAQQLLAHLEQIDPTKQAA